MYCPNCGSKVPDDAVFCPECGFRLEEPDHPEDDSVFSAGESESGAAQNTWSPYNDDADHTYLGGQDIDDRPDYSYQDNVTSGYNQDNVTSDYERDTWNSSNRNYQNENGFDRRAYGDYAEPDYPDDRDRDDYDPDYNPDDEGGHSAMPIVILIIAVAAVVLIVFGYFFMKNNSDFHLFGGGSSESTSESDESESGSASVSSKTESVTETPTASPTPTATPKTTVTPVPTATPTPTAAPTQIPTDPSATATTGGYIFPNSSTVPLTESDLAGKTAWELTVGRNEICARHGYIFNRTDLQNYFDQQSWYHRVSQFNISEVLSSTELNNMTFIQNYQDAHNLNG